MFKCSDDLADLNQYPYHVRDVHISDPCILADPASGSRMCLPGADTSMRLKART